MRELIREFDNKHPALFADYMQEFNNHPISEIIEYMWDMHDLIEDIKYRLPDDGGEEKWQCPMYIHYHPEEVKEFEQYVKESVGGATENE